MADLPVLSPLTVPEPTLAAHPASKNYVDTLQARPFFMPSDHGYLAWSVDPVYAGSSSSPNAGVLNLIAIKSASAATVTSIIVNVSTSGASLTASYVALFDSSGTRLAVSADQSSTMAASGAKTITVPSTAIQIGLYYVGLLIGSAGTMPAFARAGTSTVTNIGMAAPPFRACTSGSSLTSIPATVTMSSAAALSTEYFVAVK